MLSVISVEADMHDAFKSHGIGTDSRAFYEIVGVDILLNSTLHPFVLEVNFNPDAAVRRARLHCRFVLPLIRFIPDSLTYPVPLFLKRQCDRTLAVHPEGCEAEDQRLGRPAAARRRRPAVERPARRVVGQPHGAEAGGRSAAPPGVR